jgi:hypothetical protein
MRPILEQRTAIKNESGKEFSIKLERQQLAKLSQLLITQQYADPLSAAFREIISNAYDANNEVGPGLSVDITVEVDRVIIRDHGPGLSPESMHGLYTHIGESTKEDNANAIGAYGVGRLAPLALSKQFYIRSFHGGYETLYLCNLNEYHIPELTIWSDPEPVEADNTGLEVTIPFGNVATSKVIHTLLDLIDVSRYDFNLIKGESLTSQDDWWFGQGLKPHRYFSLNTKEEADTPVTVDYYTANRYSYGSVILDLGGALYYLKQNKGYVYSNATTISKQLTIEEILSSDLLGYRSSSATEQHCVVVIRVPPGYLPLNTSREELLKNDQTQPILDKLQALASQVISVEVNRRLSALVQQSFDQHIKKHHECADLTNVAEVSKVFLNYCTALTQRIRYYLNAEAKLSFTVDAGPHKLRYVSNGVDSEQQFPSFTYTDGLITLIEPRGSHGYIYDYLSNNKSLGCSYAVSKYYLLADSDMSYDYDGELWKEIKDYYRHAKVKATPNDRARMNPLKVINLGLTVIALRGRDITLKQLERVYGDKITGPVLVLKLSQDSSALNMLEDQLKPYGPIINYLGLYRTKSTKSVNKSSKDEVEDKTGVDLAVLLRQLRNTSDDVINVGSWEHKHTVDDLNDINEALLMEPVIYLKNNGIYTIIKTDEEYSCVSMAPRCFIKHYHPFRFTISPNAAAKIETLCEAGLCNWTSIDTVRDRLFKWLESNHSGEVLGFAGDPYMSGEQYRAIRTLLGRYIPKETKRIADWHPNFLRLCKEYSILNRKSCDDRRLLYGKVIMQYWDLLAAFNVSHDKFWQLLEIINELETRRGTAPL